MQSCLFFSILKKSFFYHTLWDIFSLLTVYNPRCWISLILRHLLPPSICMPPHSTVICLCLFHSMDVAFAKNSNDVFVLNLITCFFFTSFLLLIFVARNKFVMFTYLVPVPSIRGTFSDDRNLIYFMHHCIPISWGVARSRSLNLWIIIVVLLKICPIWNSLQIGQWYQCCFKEVLHFKAQWMYSSVNFELPVIWFRILDRWLNMVTNSIFACLLPEKVWMWRIFLKG